MGREILTQWVTPGGGATTVMNFQTTTPAAAQRAAIEALFNDLSVGLSSQVSFTVAQEGAEYDDATGLQTDFWTDPTVRGGTGDAGGEPVADATQVLIRWRTPAVVAGRRLQGRTFVPGYLSTGVISGNVSTATQTAFTAAAVAFAGAGVGFAVYSRPTAGRAGTLAAVNSGSCWSELAVQRRRRN